MSQPNYDLSVGLFVVGCPIYECHPWESMHGHLDKFDQFFQSTSVHVAPTSTYLFPITLHQIETSLIGLFCLTIIFCGEVSLKNS